MFDFFNQTRREKSMRHRNSLQNLLIVLKTVLDNKTLTKFHAENGKIFEKNCKHFALLRSAITLNGHFLATARKKFQFHDHYRCFRAFFLKAGRPNPPFPPPPPEIFVCSKLHLPRNCFSAYTADTTV